MERGRIIEHLKIVGHELPLPTVTGGDMQRIFATFGFLLIFAIFPLRAQCAETVYLFLKANGQEIKGESTQTSLGRKDSIECFSYDQKVLTPVQAGSGMATGRRQYEPIAIRKRIDKASPLLLKALIQNENIEGVFKFFRPNPKGDGTTELFYTVEIKNARIASVRQLVLDTTIAANAQEPPLEEVTFVGGTITWTYTSGGVTVTDNASHP
jgi:type VI secretion system secreted protein Hcp